LSTHPGRYDDHFAHIEDDPVIRTAKLGAKPESVAARPLFDYLPVLDNVGHYVSWNTSLSFASAKVAAVVRSVGFRLSRL
jgi:hypothetical protein